MIAAIALLALLVAILLLMSNKLSNRVDALEKYTGIGDKNNGIDNKTKK